MTQTHLSRMSMKTVVTMMAGPLWHAAVCLGLVGLVVLGITQPTQAFQPTVHILVAADSNRDMRRPEGPLPNRITEHLYESLQDEGFAVHTLHTLNNVGYMSAPAKHEILEAARQQTRPPMDLVILHQSRIKMRRSPNGPVAKIELEMDVLEVSTGRRLEVLRAPHMRPIHLPRRCDRRCMMDHLRDDIVHEVEKLTDGMIDVLHHYIPEQEPYYEEEYAAVPGLCGLKRGWELTFSNFNPSLMTQVEDYLVAFSCYQAHRPTTTNVGTYVFWYESGITPAHLQRNLRRMADDMGIDLDLSGSGTRYMVTFTKDTLFSRNAEQFDGW